MHQYLQGKYQNLNEIILVMNSYLEKLIFQPETAPVFEETMKQVALFIGFDGQRPEAEFNKGPDVLWEIGNLKYLVIQCKNGATTDSICKRYCDQLTGSMSWFGEKYDATCSATPIIIHPSNIFEHACSPHPDTRVMTRDKLDELRLNLKGFAQNIVSTENNRWSPQVISGVLDNYGLTSHSFVDKFTTRHRVKG